MQASLHFSSPDIAPEGLHWLTCAFAAFMVPLTFSMYRLSVGGVMIRLADLISLSLLVIVSLVNPVSLLSHLLRFGLIPLSLLLLYILFQGAALGVLASALKESAQIAIIFASCASAALYCKEYPQTFRRFFVWGLALSALSTVIYHLQVGQYTGYKLAGDGRYIFGNFSVMLLLLVFSQRRARLGHLLVLAVSAVPLALSLERRGILGVLVVLALLMGAALCRATRFRPSVVIATVALAAAAMGAAYTATTPLDLQREIHRAAPVDEEEALYVSNAHRKSLLANGLLIAQERWAFGYGADQIKTQMAGYYFDARLANGTHNFYLDTFIKYGLVGSLLFFFVVAYIIGSIHRRWTYSTEGFVLIGYTLLTIGFMSDGAAVLIMLFSSLLFCELTRADRDKRTGPAQ